MGDKVIEMTEVKRRRHHNVFAALFVVSLAGLALVSAETDHVIQSKAALFLAVIFAGAHLWAAVKDRGRGRRHTQFEDDDYLHAVSRQRQTYPLGPSVIEQRRRHENERVSSRRIAPLDDLPSRTESPE